MLELRLKNIAGKKRSIFTITPTLIRFVKFDLDNPHEIKKRNGNFPVIVMDFVSHLCFVI